jgi:hypothetical protein
LPKHIGDNGDIFEHADESSLHSFGIFCPNISEIMAIFLNMQMKVLSSTTKISEMMAKFDKIYEHLKI